MNDEESNTPEELNTVYTFSAAEKNRTIAHEIILPDDATWPEVLRAFTDFLGAVYGYQPDKLVELVLTEGLA